MFHTLLNTVNKVRCTHTHPKKEHSASFVSNFSLPYLDLYVLHYTSSYPKLYKAKASFLCLELLNQDPNSSKGGSAAMLPQTPAMVVLQLCPHQGIKYIFEIGGTGLGPRAEALLYARIFRHEHLPLSFSIPVQKDRVISAM